MTEITPEKLRDFQLCRHLYHRKHIDGVDARKGLAEREQLGVEFDDALMRTVKWYYFEMMGGKIPSFKSMTWKWEKLWFNNVTAADIMTSQSHPGKNRNSYNTDAHKALLQFYNTHQKKVDVFMINEHYTIPLTASTKILGTIDLVIIEDGKVVIKQLSSKTARAWGAATELGYKMVLDSTAFRYKTNTVENKVNIELLKEGKNIDMVVTDVDIERARGLAEEIDSCKNFYPSPGCYFCDQCRLKKDCWTYNQ